MIKHIYTLLVLIIIGFSACQTETTDDTVWEINKMTLQQTTTPNQYYQSLQNEWVASRESAIENGVVKSYEIIPVTNKKGWEFLLITEYENEKKFKDFRDDEVANATISFKLDEEKYAKNTYSEIMTNEEFMQLMSVIKSGA